MTASGEEHTYDFPVEDFDKSLLPPHARTPGTDAFREEVSKQIQKDFAEFTGWVQIAVGDETIQVKWRQDPKRPDPVKVVVGMLQRGEFRDAIRILEHMRRQQPEDFGTLCNLGMALNDIGEFQQAEVHLRHALAIAPKNVTAMVALGVALLHEDRTSEASEILRAAVAQEPDNLWANRNLGVCYMRTGQIEEASACLRRAFELNPQDQQAVFGYAQAMHAKGQLKEADELYRQTIALDEQSEVANVARKERTKLAELSFRSAVSIGVRPDATAYCLDALRKFGEMTPDQVRKIGVEIALLGQRGLDTNSPDQKYKLKNLPGQFSGLHLVCLMYVAFKQVGPDGPMGFDLTKEYQAAKKMWEGEA